MGVWGVTQFVARVPAAFRSGVVGGAWRGLSATRECGGVGGAGRRGSSAGAGARVVQGRIDARRGSGSLWSVMDSSERPGSTHPRSSGPATRIDGSAANRGRSSSGARREHPATNDPPLCDGSEEPHPRRPGRPNGHTPSSPTDHATHPDNARAGRQPPLSSRRPAPAPAGRHRPHPTRARDRRPATAVLAPRGPRQASGARTPSARLPRPRPPRRSTDR